MAHAMVHFEIGGPDAKALQDFYGALCGWTIDANNPMNYPIVYRMPGGIGGGLPQSPDGSAFVTFYATCGDDVGGMLDKAASLGGKRVLEPMTVPGGGPTIAAFRDPDDNLIGLVGGTESEKSPVEGKGAPVAWFEVGCGDAAKGQQFYRDLFGWEINADNPMKYGEVKAIGNGVGGGISPSPQGPYTTVYIAFDDPGAALAKANELGGKTVNEPMEVPGGPTIAHFTDPAGNFIGILKPS